MFVLKMYMLNRSVLSIVISSPQPVLNCLVGFRNGQILFYFITKCIFSITLHANFNIQGFLE